MWGLDDLLIFLTVLMTNIAKITLIRDLHNTLDIEASTPMRYDTILCPDKSVYTVLNITGTQSRNF